MNLMHQKSVIYLMRMWTSGAVDGDLYALIDSVRVTLSYQVWEKFIFCFLFIYPVTN